METFTDPRDGETYKTVQIGNLLWFTENLRYLGIEHYFPDRNSDNIHKYGCLYTWENAKAACPKGWRLPTKDEFNQLLTVTEAYISPPNLRAPSWRNGLNYSGFGALPAGYKNTVGCFFGFGSDANFWSATPHADGVAYRLRASIESCYVSGVLMNFAFSVRCVKEI